VIGPWNVATDYLINSRRRITINSGRITVFFRSIASAKTGGEAKLVQPGLLRAPLEKGFWRAFRHRQPPTPSAGASGLAQPLNFSPRPLLKFFSTSPRLKFSIAISWPAQKFQIAKMIAYENY
jgi:hypothetical protein